MAGNWHPHTLVSFGGDMNDGEIWNCTLRIVSPNGTNGPISEPEGYVQAQGPKLKTWFTNSAARLNAGARLTYLKANSIGNDGKYSDPNVTHQFDISGAQGGTNGTQAAFTSLVTSWTTDHSRGLAHRGRMYLPWALPAVVDSGSRISTQFRDDCADFAKQLLDILAGNISTDGEYGWPVVASAKNQAWNRITGIEVGDVVDVQRRRKNRVSEAYKHLSYTSPEP